MWYLKDLCPAGPQPVYAVYAHEFGPEFELVIGWGPTSVMKQSGNKAEQEIARIVVGYSIGKHVQAADAQRNFLGYSTDTVIEDWVDECVAKIAQMAREDAEAAKSKIYVPEKPKVFEDSN
jgi:hypothetical protein